MSSLQLDGNSLSPLGMGSWHLGQGKRTDREEIEALRTGVSLGMNVIDTAEMYGRGRSETLIGKAIEDIRDDVFLVSKIYPWNANRLLMARSCENTLRRLKTDRLDLYLLHWRLGSFLGEMIHGFEKLKAEGKIRAWGVSNFDTQAMESLLKIEQGDRCATNQVLYNVGSRGVEFDLIPWSQQHNIPLMAYSPLGGKGADLAHHPVILKLAEKHQATPAALLLAWTIRNGRTLAIPESGTAAHVRDNAVALSIWLDNEDLSAIDKAFPPPTGKQKLETR